MFSLICAWTNNPDAGDLRCHHAHYGITVLCAQHPWWWASWRKNAFCIIDPLWGESIGHLWIPLTQGQHQHSLVDFPQQGPVMQSFDCFCQLEQAVIHTAFKMPVAPIHHLDFDGLAQDCSNSIANTLELLPSGQCPLALSHQHHWGPMVFTWGAISHKILKMCIHSLRPSDAYMHW